MWYIWGLSILLSALSLVIMLFLIARRVLQQRRSKAAADQRRQLLTALIAFTESRDREVLKTAILSVPAGVAINTGFEFISLLRGEEHDDVLAAFKECGLPALVGRQLEKGNGAERIHAAEMLAALRSEGAVASLLSALNHDRSREVRIAVAIALCDLNSLPPLGIALRKIGVAGQRSRRLIELFRRFPHARLEELADHAARADAVPFIRAAAIDALARAGGFRFADLFARLADDASPEVAAAALRALGLTGNADAPAILSTAMTKGDWEVRSAAADAAGRLGLAELGRPLSKLMGDEVWNVRYAAANALRSFGQPGERLLRQIADSEVSRSQRTASLILAEGPAV
ncbi:MULTISPECIES: HEAT repeat domain-containing protein [unclassified Mesorhizobium]|uniref:HEAT repeat domain-containing protein n=1 Tax=unclassified Mesorhizobium TaxID=325217 RepID=UPI001CCC4C2C|nr:MULTISPECIES: HEAT repeat domain-containing protein [unclassified Mesorhizobium]MBZ9921725.1 HEAT repeat domain-containing protein [Mesorhizobium sp. BR1-1-7]MBZ9956211.1 HEAT repeat domain-containing protein [Mesorhizobium sp. BR1-1-15]MBZ9973189.1 HEAT repeat domain-containing protein [Mesorhizobium sp. BR1-1-12]